MALTRRRRAHTFFQISLLFGIGVDLSQRRCLTKFLSLESRSVGQAAARNVSLDAYREKLSTVTHRLCKLRWKGENPARLDVAELDWTDRGYARR
jgi:hypothetical protein